MVPVLVTEDFAHNQTVTEFATDDEAQTAAQRAVLRAKAQITDLKAIWLADPETGEQVKGPFFFSMRRTKA